MLNSLRGLRDPAFISVGRFPGQEVRSGCITMEALGLVTWWPWLRRVAAVGSPA